LSIFLVPLWAVGLRGQQPGPQTASLPTLTQIEQIRELTPEQANRGYPVRLRAVVTYYVSHATNLLPQMTDAAPAAPDIFIQDATAGIWINAPPGGPEAKHGQLIEIEGVSEAPDFAPQIGKPRWRVVGQAPMPAPHHPTFERMASTQEDSQWVEIEGVVRTAEAHMGFLTLSVAVSGGRVKASIPQFHQRVPARLIDAEVRIRGACGALFNSKNQLVGVLLYVPSLDEVRIKKPAPADPFATAAQPPFGVQQFSPATASGHRIHVRGVVTFQQPGSLLYISYGLTGLRVETSQPTVLHAGDRVDVVGFPHLSNFRPVLEDATFRLIGNGPVPVTAKQLLEGDYDSELVSIKADLLEKSLLPGGRTLILQDGSLIVDAAMASGRLDGMLDSLRAGSHIQLTGVCVDQKDEDGRHQSFRILFDQPDDVTVISQPPWWTPQYASRVLGYAGVILLAAMVWVVVLRRRVQQQTETIRRRLEREAVLEEQYKDLFENANDLIQSVDAQGKLLYANRVWKQTLGYTDEDIRTLSVFDVVHPDHREHYAELLRRLMAGESVERVETEFVNKRGEKVILEGTANCHFAGGKPMSARGIFRNITARKQAEESLRRERTLLRTLIDNTPDYIYVKDTENRFLVASTALAHRMGAVSAEDVLGKTDRDFYPEELATKFIHDEQEIMRTGRPVINREDCVQDASGNMVCI
jgi:PAS domain S-box-containing protein